MAIDTEPFSIAPQTAGILKDDTGIDLSYRTDLLPHRRHLEEALFYARQRREQQLTANTLEPTGLTMQEACREQERVVEFVRQNGEVPFVDKLAYVRTHPLRGIPLGYKDHVANWQGTHELDGQVVKFLYDIGTSYQTVDGWHEGENMVGLSRQDAIKRITYGMDDLGPFRHVLRTRDVAWINNDDTPPQVGGRIDLAVRKRSSFLLDLGDPEVSQPFDIYRDALHHYEQLAGLPGDALNGKGYNAQGFDAPEIDSGAVAALSRHKDFLDQVIEQLIQSRASLLVPVSTIYYIRRYR